MTTAADNFGPLPPHDHNAEMALLGSAMLLGDDRATFSKIRHRIAPGHFYQSDYGVIYGVLCDLFDADVKFDFVPIRAELARRQLLEEIGGVVELAKLLNSVPNAAHAEHYADIVARCAKEREAISIFNAALRDLHAAHSIRDNTDHIARTIAKLRKLDAEGARLSIVKLDQAVQRYMDNADSGEFTSIDTGFAALDMPDHEGNSFRGVFRLGGYTIIAARPSIGKSCMIRDRLLFLSMAGMHTGLIAVEEDESKIAGNCLSSVTGINNHRVADPRSWGNHEWEQVRDGAVKLSKAPMFLNDSCKTVADVIGAAEVLATEFKCRVIAVDHLHLIRSGRRFDRRHDELTDISWDLKNTWKGLKVCGLVAAQLNRPEKGRVPAPPELTDLRECGGIEEHADAVLFLHREDYYHRNDPDYRADNKCHVGIAKNRNGAVGGVMVMADLAHQRFMDYIEVDPFQEQFR